MNKQRHKTWSFCLKYYILSKSNKIQRQVGGIFHLWQFLLDQIAHGRWPGIKKWRHVNKWKPWSFQLHCAVKPYFSVTKWKMHLLNTWQEYKSCQTNGENCIIHHQVTNHWTNSTWRRRRDHNFRSKFCYFKVWSDVLFYSKLVPMHVCWYCLCYIKISFYCVIPYSEYREKNNMVLLKSYEAVTEMAVALVAPPVNER